jgi:hypothetical protein
MREQGRQRAALARALFLASLALIALIALPGCGLHDPYDSTETRAASTAPSGANGQIASPDPEDLDPNLRAQRAEQIRAHPALQHLPADAGPVSVDFEASDAGRLTLVVTYSGRRASARAILKRLLGRWGDRPDNYALKWIPTTAGLAPGGDQ